MIAITVCRTIIIIPAKVGKSLAAFIITVIESPEKYVVKILVLISRANDQKKYFVFSIVKSAEHNLCKYPEVELSLSLFLLSY